VTVVGYAVGAMWVMVGAIVLFGAFIGRAFGAEGVDLFVIAAYAFVIAVAVLTRPNSAVFAISAVASAGCATFALLSLQHFDQPLNPPNFVFPGLLVVIAVSSLGTSYFARKGCI
jgi:hypothetical protein